MFDAAACLCHIKAVDLQRSCCAVVAAPAPHPPRPGYTAQHAWGAAPQPAADMDRESLSSVKCRLSNALLKRSASLLQPVVVVTCGGYASGAAPTMPPQLHTLASAAPFVQPPAAPGMGRLTDGVVTASGCDCHRLCRRQLVWRCVHVAANGLGASSKQWATPLRACSACCVLLHQHVA